MTEESRGIKKKKAGRRVLCCVKINVWVGGSRWVSVRISCELRSCYENTRAVFLPSHIEPLLSEI